MLVSHKFVFGYVDEQENHTDFLSQELARLDDTLERAQRLTIEADLLLCVGSSLEVYPVAQLPSIALQTGASLAIVTQGPTPYDADATVKLDGDVEAELQALVAAL